jgi:hypothetical protein
MPNVKFEQTESGLQIPTQELFVGGVYEIYVNGELVEELPNLVTTEGLNYLLEVALAGGSQISNWYVTAYKNAVTPAANWDASNFDSTADEIDATDVTAATRQPWSNAAVSSAQVDNYASKAEYTVLSATLDLNGVAFVSNANYGDVTGKVLSATQFGATRSLLQDDVLGIGYRFTAASA